MMLPAFIFPLIHSTPICTECLTWVSTVLGAEDLALGMADVVSNFMKLII